MITVFKVVAAAGCVLAIAWVCWMQYRLAFWKRLAVTLLGVALLFPTFVLVVSVRCDLADLPADECSLGALTAARSREQAHLDTDRARCGERRGGRRASGRAHRLTPPGTRP